MSDLAERLKRRTYRRYVPEIQGAEDYPDEDCVEAATRIAELEAENKKLKDALNRLGSFEAITAPYVSSIAKTMESEELIARISFARAAALGEKP